MSTPELALRRDLMRLGRRRQSRDLLLTVARQMVPVMALLVVALLADQLLALPAAVRLLVLLAMSGLVVSGLYRVITLWAQRTTPERTAQRIEEAVGISDNRLINGCQFAAGDPQQRRSLGEAAMMARSIAAASSTIATVPLTTFYRVADLRRWLLILGAVSAVAAGYAGMFPDRCRNGLTRYLLPLADVPPLGAVRIAVEPGAAVTVDEGAALTITVHLTPSDGRGSVAGVQPELISAPGNDGLATERTAGECRAIPQVGDAWALTLPALSKPFMFRIHAAGSWSTAIPVQVLPPPAITSARFRVTSPAYAGAETDERPGPPATLSVLPGSRVRVDVALDRAVTALRWHTGQSDVVLSSESGRWVGDAAIDAAGPYELQAGTGSAARVITRGAVQLAADAPPTCTVSALQRKDSERNLLLSPGASITLQVQVADDHGLAVMRLAVQDGEMLKNWTFIGPPGPRTGSEHLAVTMDPLHFPPGRTYLIAATAIDGHGQSTISAPLVVRVRTLSELELPATDPRQKAFAALKEALAAELHARGITATIIANRAEIEAHRSLAVQRQAQTAAQHTAGERIDTAAKRFAETADERTSLQVRAIGVDAQMLESGLAQAELPAIANTQDTLIARLTALLGVLADQARRPDEVKKSETPADGVRRKLEQLRDDVTAFTNAQERVIEQSKTLAAKNPADLTDGDRKVLGELASEENAWAKFLREAVSDLAKLPPQDFTDASMAQETNSVYQEVKLAADALTRKNIELAVPREQNGLELAKSLEQNLEKWLMNTPDKVKWAMEDAPAPADVPVAELPKELEDIVGDLLDKEEAMTDDVEDVTSAWMDSIDKGAGWDAGDGPISNMSAKGITGNQLPNQSEISGRAGEGRTGRSNGQFVQDEAVGKKGRDTPTRLTDTPFERGSVKDSSKEQPNGATGGGKVAGSAAEGLVGHTPPPPVRDGLARLAGNQAKLRQQAGAIALQLRSRKLPSGDLENAVAAMAGAEQAALNPERPGAVTALRQRVAEAVGALGDARRSIAGAASVQQERSALPEQLRRGLQQGTPDTVPAGYEEMVGTYFQALSGAGSGAVSGATP